MILQRNRARTHRRAGFSLMELLVVVAILVVLAGVGGVVYLNIQESNYKDAARIQIKNLENTCKLYKSKFGDFPESLEALTTEMPNGDGPMLEPSALRDPWGRQYQYTPQSQGAIYQKPEIWSDGPRPGDPNSRISNNE
jgi:general secretion pathway protein G